MDGEINYAIIVAALLFAIVVVFLVCGFYKLTVFLIIKSNSTYSMLDMLVKQKNSFDLQMFKSYKSLSTFSNNANVEKTLKFLAGELEVANMEDKILNFNILQNKINEIIAKSETRGIIWKKLLKMNAKIDEPKISVQHHYSSPQGRSRRSETITLSFREILDHINSNTRIARFAKSERNKMTLQLRKQVLGRDGYTCQRCGFHNEQGIGLHIDHVHPISKGGATVVENLQTLCSKCNNEKSNKVAV